MWDGNVPLHEWCYKATEIQQDEEKNTPPKEPAENITTWVFEAGTFVPTAKILGGKQYSIVSDYLGTPIQMYDGQGNKTWDCTLDIYGKVLAVDKGTEFDCPFRFQGQYADEETELYYNRFRYYSTEIGCYLSQDPIGLIGNNPTLYGYVNDINNWVDILGLIIVYRGDKPSVKPNEVFDKGITPKGTHYNVLLHTKSNTIRGNFVSSSLRFNIAKGFAGKNGYIYVIDTDNGIDVNKVFGENANYYEQFEYSIIGKVNREQIIGAYKLQKYKIVGDMIKNPNYKKHSH